MEHSILLIVMVIGMAYLFDFINGFHDAANAIATIVTTGVLTPHQAVIWAAFFNFIAFLFFNMMVAHTIGQGLIDPSLVNAPLLLSALAGAIVWGLFTWYFGLPSSSSHALIGGLAGAAVVKGGFSALQWAGFSKVLVGIFIVPVAGMTAGFLLSSILMRQFKQPHKKSMKRLFVLFQLGSSALLSITHGGNDAQKTMGIIAVLLFSVSWLQGSFYIPFWVVVSCQAMMSLGTFFGGWRIVKTMGHGITRLNPLRACSAETSAAMVIFASTVYGVPVSTTQTITGSIAGVGLVSGLKGTHWPVIKLIFYAWLLTVPAAGLVAAVIHKCLIG